MSFYKTLPLCDNSPSVHLPRGSRERVQGCTPPPPEMKPSSLYSLIKSVYLTSQLCHSLVVQPLLKNPGSALAPLSWQKPPKPGAHHQEPATTPCSCHSTFTDWSNFSLHLSQIQIPNGNLVTNCNQKHARANVDMFTWDCIVFSLLKPTHVDWNWPILQEKCLKIDRSVKMLLHWLIMGVAGC